MDESKNILCKARELAESCQTWADLSNSLFDPLEGLVAKTFRSAETRAKFRKTKTYDQLHKLVEEKMQATGVVAGGTPKKSGKFVVRLPRSLHMALESEAKAEGVSLNQLVVAKLAVQLEQTAGGMLARIMQAFVEVRKGYSLDRVIADPELDRKFLKRCRELGLSGTDYDLNWKLMNARKSSELTNLSALIKTKRSVLGKKTDEFEYASELAVRFLQESQGASLDQIICDPDLASQFDAYASRLAPGFSPLEYRLAAFALRKGGRLSEKQKQEIGTLPELGAFKSVSSITLESVPDNEGIYLFKSSKEAVFIGQTDNLRHRLERHLAVSDSQGLPEWLWDVKNNPLAVGIASLPGTGRSKRRAMEVVLTKQFRPVLNFDRLVA
ncbi:MAG: toxin-antitoxin system HicB family antitoxin [Planctomycetota bacterium]|jgi:site-specific DNA-methyltransferase (adenine-specific)